MTLTLTIRNMDRLDNGMPAEFVLNRRGAMIGRAATCDWSLPDPRSYISSRHCEVTYRDGFYTLTDVSTNGTLLNGAPGRMTEPRRIEPGDLFLVGQYEIVAGLSGEAAAAVERSEERAAEAAQSEGGWTGWDSHNTGPVTPAAPERGGWDDVPANGGLSSGIGGGSAPLGDGGGWGSAPAASSGGGDWGAAPASGGNDGWGAAPAAPAAPSGGGGWAPPAPSGPSLNRAQPYAQQPSAPSSGAASLGGGVGSDAWAPAAAPPPAAQSSVWDSAQAPVQQASAWSSAVSDRPKQASPNDIWGSMENSNVVDWARADFGAPKQAAADPLGLAPKPAAAALPREMPRAPMPDAPAPAPTDNGGWGAPAAPAAPPPAENGWGAPTPDAPPPAPAAAERPAPAPPAPPPPPPPAPAGGGDPQQAVMALIAAAGLPPELIKQPSAATLERAGTLIRRLVAGLVVMVEARARAKSQMGAEQTGLEFDGNNPLKFARTPDQAIAQLLNPTERGFMPAERAIEDAYFDLQSHQMATLKAMQGALRATLDRFSPAAIKKRAESGGFMTRLLPGGRDATLWQTYEKEFSGVAQGSDEAFMDIFSKEFRRAYEEQSRNRKKG